MKRIIIFYLMLCFFFLGVIPSSSPSVQAAPRTLPIMPGAVQKSNAEESKDLFQYVLDTQKRQKLGQWVHLTINQKKNPVQQSYWNNVLLPEETQREVWSQLTLEGRVSKQVFTINDAHGNPLVLQKFKDGTFTDELKSTKHVASSPDLAFDVNFGVKLDLNVFECTNCNVQVELTKILGKKAVKVTITDKLPKPASLDGKEMFYDVFRAEDYFDFNTGLLLKGVDTIVLQSGQEVWINDYEYQIDLDANPPADILSWPADGG
ncbi:MAG TPA: hypothetical protein VLR89_04495 [Anaerolineaceae bacterium]|nr:hypothetical protein [Anaerolineaceae bacterium]